MNDVLDRLLSFAKENEEVRKKLLETRESKEPMKNFCTLATELGFEISVGDLMEMGDAFMGNLLKSTNGGATYPFEEWEDIYENFMSSLE